MKCHLTVICCMLRKYKCYRNFYSYFIAPNYIFYIYNFILTPNFNNEKFKKLNSNKKNFK